MDEGTADTSYRTTRGQEVKTINVAKLPKLIKDGYDVFVPTEYTRINKAQEKKDRKKAKLMYNNTEGERPSSARSGMTAITGGMTNAYTQYTAGTAGQSKFSQATEKQEAMIQAQQVTQNKNFSLVDYIKYDTTLGREQNIDLGKESSLVSKDIMRIKGGIKLTEFAPQKRLTKAG